MNNTSFRNITDLLKLELRKSLPGEASHNKMIPVTRSPLNADMPFQNSSVLILLYPHNNEPNTVFMKRTADDTPHSGQISFPGGRFEPGDSSLKDTALREAEEELGISASEIEILGHLTPLQIQVSNMEVKPFIGVLYKKPHFRPNPGEVEYLIEVKVMDLLNPGIIENKVEYIRGNRIEMPYYNVRNTHIWGATAMILSEFLDILRNIGIRE